MEYAKLPRMFCCGLICGKLLFLQNKSYFVVLIRSSCTSGKNFVWNCVLLYLIVLVLKKEIRHTNLWQSFQCRNLQPCIKTIDNKNYNTSSSASKANILTFTPQNNFLVYQLCFFKFVWRDDSLSNRWRHITSKLASLCQMIAKYE